MNELINHQRTKHDQNINKLENEFPSTEEFMAWKSELEKKTSSWFVKFRGMKRGKEYSTTWYRCNRSGTFQSCGEGKRAMKQQGTSKINGNCTAYIKAFTSNTNGTVKIESCLDHTGHEKELSHTRMPDGLRKKIAGKLSKGVAIDFILDEI